MPTQKSRRNAYHHGNLREALLDAAERAVEAGGSGFSLRAIARDAGVTHAAAYHHFADREALLRGVAARGFDQLGAALSTGAARHRGARSFQEMGVAYVAFAARHPGLFRLMFGAEAARGRLRDATLRAASENAFTVLLGGVRQIAPRASDDAVRRQAIAAWSLVHGLSALLLDDQLAVAGLSVQDHERIARDVLSATPVEQR